MTTTQFIASLGKVISDTVRLIYPKTQVLDDKIVVFMQDGSEFQLIVKKTKNAKYDK